MRKREGSTIDRDVSLFDEVGHEVVRGGGEGKGVSDGIAVLLAGDDGGC